MLDFGNGAISRFSKNELLQLSYFENLFSERWAKIEDSSNSSPNNNANEHNDNHHHNDNHDHNHSRNKHNKHKNNNSDGNIVKLFGNSPELFDERDLHLLLRCVGLGHIPYNDGEKWDVSKLDGLANCGDFLTSNNDNFVLNTASLIDYFKKRVPRITHPERQDLLNRAKSQLLRNALNEWNNELMNRIEEHRQNMVSKHSSLNLCRARLDPQTAIAIFIAKFKLEMQHRRGKIIIKIVDFTNKEEYLNLWMQRKEQNYTNHYNSNRRNSNSNSNHSRNHSYSMSHRNNNNNNNNSNNNIHNRHNSFGGGGTGMNLFGSSSNPYVHSNFGHNSNSNSNTNSNSNRYSHSHSHSFSNIHSIDIDITSPALKRDSNSNSNSNNRNHNLNNITHNEGYYGYDIINKSIIPQIIEKLESPDLANVDKIMFGNNEQRVLIKTIISNVCHDFVSKEIDSRKVNVSLLRVLLCRMRIMYEADHYYKNPHSALRSVVTNLGSNEDKKNFLKFMLSKHDRYSKHYHIRNTDGDEQKQTRISGLEYWFSLLNHCILTCHESDIIELVEQWFPILHEKNRSINERKLAELNNQQQQQQNANGNANGDGNGSGNDNGNNNNGVGDNGNSNGAGVVVGGGKNNIINGYIGKFRHGANNWHDATAAWIEKKIVPKLSSQSAFEFALYLSNYFVFTREEDDQFSQKYLDLIQTDLGIPWEIIPKDQAINLGNKKK